MLSIILETFSVIAVILCQILKATFRFFIPVPAKNIANEIVLITGAGSGIGKLLALKIARKGAVVVCVDINQQANEETVVEIKSAGFKAHGYKCDCSSRDDIYRMAELVKKEIGDVSILINNAGIVSGKKFMDTEDWMIQKTFEVNTMAHFWTTKAFLPSMIEKNHGHIVSIASSAGLVGVNGLCDYCASKFGAVGFDESLRMELINLKKDGIHTTIVCPYFINTGMFDGVQTRFPLLLPILDPDWATDQMIDAMLRNQVTLYIPRILNLMLWLKNTLPCSTYNTLSTYFGANKSMDHFKGRSKKDQ